MRRISFALLLCVGLLANAPLTPVQAASDAGWLLAQINCLRQSVGAGPLALNASLNTSATIHSAYLATASVISNYHTQPDGSTPQSRANAAGFSGSVGENVVTGSNVAQAFNWWRNDDIHYRNMINVYWSQVGVGIASGSNGTWYTLDFGAPTWTANRVTPASCGSFIVPTSLPQSAPPAVSNASGNSGSSANVSRPPASTDSLDAQGNIKHQVQAGETLGHIALLYGYTWADIPAMLALNHMTEADFRKLKIGSIFLVPSKAGTFTPQPGNTNSPNAGTPTPPATTETVTGTPTQPDTLSSINKPANTPTSAPTFTVTAMPTDQPTEAPTMSPTSPPTQAPLIAATTALTTISQLPTIAPMLVIAADPPPDPNYPTDNPLRRLLPWAIVAQGVVLGGLFWRFVWRRR